MRKKLAAARRVCAPLEHTV